MSRRHWEAWAREVAFERELTALQAHVLVLLATFANDTGECCPGRETIAGRARRDERWIGEALRDLVQLGLIERRRRGPGQTAITRLRPDRADTSHQQDRALTSGQDKAPTSGQVDRTSASPKTRHGRPPRPDRGAPQNPQEEPPEELDPCATPYAAGRAGARDGAGPGGEGEGALDLLVEQVWSILRDALDWLGPNDHGHPWPQPNRQTIREALDQHRELWPMARNVAIETKTTVLDQNRAPNIAGLFASKIRDYGRARAERAA